MIPMTNLARKWLNMFTPSFFFDLSKYQKVDFKWGILATGMSQGNYAFAMLIALWLRKFGLISYDLNTYYKVLQWFKCVTNICL